MAHRDKYKFAKLKDGSRARERRQKQAQKLRHGHRDKAMALKRVITDEQGLFDEEEMTEAQASSILCDLLQQLEQKGGKDNVLRKIAQLLSRGSLYVEEFLKIDGSFATIVTFLDLPETQMQACCCITNMAASIPSHTKMAAQACPQLIAILGTGSSHLQQQAAWALGNIAADSPELRDMAHAQGASTALLALAKLRLEPGSARQVWFALSLLCRGQGAPIDQLVEQGLLLALVENMKWLSETDVEAFCEAAWCATYVTARQPRNCQQLLELGCLPMLVAALSHFVTIDDADDFILPIIRCLGNFVAVSDEALQFLCQQDDFFPTLVQCLTTSHRPVQLETCWLLSNACAAHESVASQAVSAGILPHMARLLKGPAMVKREVAFCILPIASYGEQTLDALIDANIVAGMLDLVRQPDPEIKLQGIQFCELICRHSPQGMSLVDPIVDYLEGLQYDDAELISKAASEFVDRYFNRDDEITAEAMAPPTSFEF